ncbi:MAG: hypothetical protein GFH25_541210n24 [Chloroflexi bacterium AL-N10]|nr:hypothetical protein [Chloroflexi bacterium AL-N1]NOK69597.1 hypothetical protein [Chloroflexi bacterium AL-N10]NOK72144.1 hypothetical protein [Chloroflexi bacterium AL-N5]
MSTHLSTRHRVLKLSVIYIFVTETSVYTSFDSPQSTETVVMRGNDASTPNLHIFQLATEY